MFIMGGGSMPRPHLNRFMYDSFSVSINKNEVTNHNESVGGGETTSQLKCHDLLLCRCHPDFTEMVHGFDILIRKEYLLLFHPINRILGIKASQIRRACSMNVRAFDQCRFPLIHFILVWEIILNM